MDLTLLIPTPFLQSALDLSAGGFAYCALAVLVGAFVKGYAGFGASMLWATSLSLVLPPLEIVPMVLLFEVATSIHLLPMVWREVEWRSLGLLMVGTWVATPLGVLALAALPADAVRMALGVVVLLAALMLWRGFRLHSVPGRPATLGVGFMAGFLNGSMGIVGPPVILFYFSSPLGFTVGRASMVTYLLGTDTVGAGMFAGYGLLTPVVLWRTAVFLPVLLLGVALGHRGFLGTGQETFRRAALVLLMALAIALLIRALLG